MLELAARVQRSPESALELTSEFACLMTAFSGPFPPCTLITIAYLHKVFAFSHFSEARYDLVCGGSPSVVSAPWHSVCLQASTHFRQFESIIAGSDKAVLDDCLELLSKDELLAWLRICDTLPSRPCPPDPAAIVTVAPILPRASSTLWSLEGKLEIEPPTTVISDVAEACWGSSGSFAFPCGGSCEYLQFCIRVDVSTASVLSRMSACHLDDFARKTVVCCHGI